MFLSQFYPNAYIEDVYSINYEELYEIGFRGLIFDIDNTLVPHGKESNETVDNLFVRLHKLGFKTLLLSNNCESRIKQFNANINTLYIHNANKPSPNGFADALKALELNKQNTLVIGDQIFTDILGANRAGIKSILVKYIGYYNNEWKGFRRIAEALILLFFRFSKKSDLKLNTN